MKIYRRSDLIAALLVALFFIVFFHRALLGAEFLLVSDPFTYSYPLRTIAWEMIRAGSLPLWTPHLFAGYPLLSMAQLALAYPLTWGYLVLPGHWAEQLYVLAPYLLSPLWTYLYAREVGRSREAALLSGLSFGYGGMMASWLANGLLPNAVMWLPLALVGIERSRRGPLSRAMLGVTGAYLLSILSGVGQGFTLVGALILAYALYLALTMRAHRFRPIAAAAGGIALAAALSAFQILESLQAAALSIRSRLSYETFSQLSYTPRGALLSFLAPAYYYVEAVLFVPPVTAALALVAIYVAARRVRRASLVFFWLAVAIIAGLLVLGPHTPLYRLAYQIPVLNRFRGASRHAFEFTFAVSVLGAWGWDALGAHLRRRRGPQRSVISARAAAAACVVASAGIGIWWWFATSDFMTAALRLDLRRSTIVYLVFKSLSALAVAGGICLAWRVEAARERAALLVSLILIASFVEPYILKTRWWGRTTLSAERIAQVAPATLELARHAPEHNRVYTRVKLFAEQYSDAPRVDPPNLTARAGLHNVAGYEPLIPRRLSRALGDVWLDGVTPLSGGEPGQELFEPRSRVLDLLNTRYLLCYANLLVDDDALQAKDGIEFTAADLRIEIPREGPLAFGTLGAAGDTIAFVTTMANSGMLAQDEPVARLIVTTEDGKKIERLLLAGRDTSEWAYDRADVRPLIRHARAPIFDSVPGDETASFLAHRYWTRVDLGARVRVARVEIIRLTERVPLILWKAALDDRAGGGRSVALAPEAKLGPLRDASRWQLDRSADGVLILRNERALPRVWLAGAVEAVSAPEALRRIRGESDQPFDPRQTALVEAAPEELPRLGGALATARAEIVRYEPSRIVIETEAEGTAFLVASEIYYPGWEARVDGAKARIFRTDYLLRGLAVPPGRHRVEMRYTAPQARRGAAISLAALLIVLLLARRGWKRRPQESFP
jgi:hypothetical protein